MIFPFGPPFILIPLSGHHIFIPLKLDGIKHGTSYLIALSSVVPLHTGNHPGTAVPGLNP